MYSMYIDKLYICISYAHKLWEENIIDLTCKISKTILMYLKCRQFLILHVLFKIYSHVSLLILLVSDNQGFTIYCTSGKGLFICFKFVDRYMLDFGLIWISTTKWFIIKNSQTMQFRIYLIIKILKNYLNKSSCKNYV